MAHAFYPALGRHRLERVTASASLAWSTQQALGSPGYAVRHRKNELIDNTSFTRKQKLSQYSCSTWLTQTRPLSIQLHHFLTLVLTPDHLPHHCHQLLRSAEVEHHQ